MGERDTPTAPERSQWSVATIHEGTNGNEKKQIPCGNDKKRKKYCMPLPPERSRRGKELKGHLAKNTKAILNMISRTAFNS